MLQKLQGGQMTSTCSLCPLKHGLMTFDLTSLGSNLPQARSFATARGLKDDGPCARALHQAATGPTRILRCQPSDIPGPWPAKWLCATTAVLHNAARLRST